MRLTVNLRAIVPHQEDYNDMARRRYQRPDLLKTDAKRPRWYFRARVDVRTQGGIERKESNFYLGFCDEKGKRAAEKERDAILSEAINKPQVIIQSQVLFAEVLKAFRQDHVPTVKDVTQRSYKFYIGHYIEPTFAERRLCDIDSRAVQQWANGIANYSTRKAAIGIFAVVWHKAIAWNYTQTVCPTQFVSLGTKRSKYAREIPTKDQFRKILARLPEIHRDICELIVTTGMRISEVRGLPVRCVDFAGRSLKVEQRLDQFDGLDIPKSFKARRVLPLGYMAERLRRYVKPGAKPDDLLFGKALPNYQECHYRLVRCARDAGFQSPGFGHHSLRAANATWLRKGGLSIDDAKEQLGHASDQIANLYLRTEADDYRRRERAVLELQAELMGEVNGGVQ